MDKLGLVGLANAGKSTLFNALTGLDTPVAPHPFTTTDTTIAEAVVPDERVDALAAIHHSRKLVYAHMQLADIAGLTAGSSQGAGLGNRFLGQLREADAILYVLRAFHDDRVPGDDDPIANLDALELELTLADLASVESALERRRKVARSDPSARPEVAALEVVQAVLADGIPLYRATLETDVLELVRSAFLITTKPAIAVINADEGAEADVAVEDTVRGRLGDHATVVTAPLALEAELARLEPAERAEMMEALAIGSSALERIARAAFETLERWTFFTSGDKDTHAWTFRRGSNAQTCAGIIHSDLARGFIRAEVASWRDVVEAGSWTRAKAQNKVRLEGRDYLVADGDVLEIRFNV
ncbi:GTP-binding protein YchF [Acidimicrobium ferrooxidans DSM 10331]|uniref:GTP-binding protein YchF n=2 Tax=Acidimicrobium ferrooxidans TaxID=53635 RepID=C7M399_ACIFD|nr:GTP-binding protein YchF [Acidimicrobium ferrooxidans DSM 10331]